MVVALELSERVYVTMSLTMNERGAQEGREGVDGLGKVKYVL